MILTKENILSFTLYQDIKIKNSIQNTFRQNEFAQMFNKLYDSNFLAIINDLSSQIQSFYKSSNTQFNIMKSFFTQNENNKQITDIQNTFNNIELSMSQFYSSAKILFKKMKLYRNEKMKSTNLVSTNRTYKRSNTIIADKSKKNIPLLLNFDNIKDNINKNIINYNSGWDSERSQKNKKILNADIITESNVNANNMNNSNNTNVNYNNSNNFSLSCNTTIDKESNILLIEEKNQYSNILLENVDSLNKHIKSLEEALSLHEDNNNNNDNNNKIKNIINNIKKISNSIKDNISTFSLNSDNQDKKIISDLSNKINLLNEENINVKKQYEKYRNEEKIKRKFFENQILNLSNKINEYEKTKKNTETKLKEIHNKYEEEISNKNTILNDELKIKTQKIKTLEETIKETTELIANKDKEILSLQKKLNDYENKTTKGDNIICSADDSKKIPDDNDENRKNNNFIDNNKINPDNYSIVKIYQYNNKLRWILFKKNKSMAELKNIKSNKSNLGNSNNNDKSDYNYNDFIWMAYKEEKDFSEFGDLSLFIEKEKDYDNIIMKLNQKNKSYENKIEKLKNENYNLNNIILKYKSEVKEDKNLIGVSFIEEDPESSKFIDDKCCEDILTGLDKNKEHNKNDIKDSYYNINLKNSIDLLMTKVIPTENVRSLICSILRQLGCSDEDILKLVGKHRGAISIPFSINKHINK